LGRSRLGHLRHLACGLEAAEAGIGIAPPGTVVNDVTGGLAELAVVRDVDAGLVLICDYLAHCRGEARGERP
jgi:hypothetical protein